VFLKQVSAAVSALDFLIDSTAKTENLATETGMLRVSRAVQQLIACAPGAVQRDRMVQRAAERLGLSQSALRRDLARAQQRHPAARKDAAAPASVAPRASHPVTEVTLVQLLCLYYAEVFPVVADHLPPDYVHDSDCRLVFELLLDSQEELIERISPDRAAAKKLAVRVQMEDSRLLGEDNSPAGAAQDVVMKLWRRALKARRAHTEDFGERARITMQLNQLDQGWVHAVEFMVV
jgi:DNA primase